MKVLTLTFPDRKIEAYMLNPGERFAGFGGSKSALVVGDTAIMVLRTTDDESGTQDSEHEITFYRFWAILAEMLDGRVKLPLHAVACDDEPGKGVAQ